MSVSWIFVMGFAAIVLLVLIAYFTRERAGHNVRRDVREAAVSNGPKDPERGIRS